MEVIRSRDNPRLRRWIKLAEDPRERRREGKAVIEGPHLVEACLGAGHAPEGLILSEGGVAREAIAALARRSAAPVTVLEDKLFALMADAESPPGIAAEIRLPPEEVALDKAHACVFLEGIQDPGNVGAILRSAAAFGVSAAVLGPGCADAWSPKVLRAAMGAHFALHLGRSESLGADLARFGGRIACAVPRGGVAPAAADFSGRVGWILGSEGQGVSAGLAALATLKVTIPMCAGAESLNVAAAAAILFYEAYAGPGVSRRGAPA